MAEGRAFRAEHDRATAEVGKLTAEVADLDRAAARLAELSAEAEGWREAEARLRLVEAVVAAQAALAALPDPRPLVPPDEPAVEAARAQAEAARTVVATVQAGLEAAMAERDRARLAVERSSHLTGEADCPLCGQALGDAFKAVQASRAEELLAIEGRVTDLEVDRRQAGRAATAAAEKATAAARALKLAQAAWADHERLAARRADAVEALVSAQAVLGESSRSGHAGQPLDQGEPARLAQEVERRRRAADECQRISGRLERRGVAAAELDVEQAKVDESKGRLEALREKVASLAYRPQQLTAARAESDRLREAADVAVERAQAKRVLAGQARTGAEAAARRMADADVQHSQLVVLGDEARHLGRLADLLNAFRNTLVATVGPRLSAQAAELFAELTDSEYDLLKVDPDTYEIKVCDAGAEYGMSRFSGSETDLANLALRVAVSEHVRFQSGGAVGLLVLDEVFGPLDDDRKGRMLLALERLRARFRQVLVVTHDAAIKEQLPNAIEVLKLPGRRATARVITG